MKATIVEPEDVPYIWDNVAPLLSKVIQHSEGELGTDDYLSNLMSGSMQLWIVTEDGKIIPMDVKVGDKVLFGKWSGTEIKIDGKEYSIMKESDIMGISSK